MYPVKLKDKRRRWIFGVGQAIMLVFVVWFLAPSQCKTEEVKHASVVSKVSKSGQIIRTPAFVVSQEPIVVLAQADVRSELPVPAAKKTTRKYKVLEGDALSLVFPRNWKQVCESNGFSLKDCDNIRVGQVFVLPDGVVASKVARRATRKSCVTLGVAPFNPVLDKKKMQQGVALLPLSSALKEELIKKIYFEEAERGVKLPFEARFDMVFQSHTKPKLLKDVRLCTIEEGGRVEEGLVIQLSDGTEVAVPYRCGNISIMRRPKPVSAVITPVQRGVTSVSPGNVLLPISAFPKKDIAEWEVIVGAGVWDNKLAHGQWHYGEAAVTAILPDGYRFGGGVFGMWGRGASETSDYRWREHGYGPQLVFKRNFLKEQTDEFGQTALMPAMWGLKLRYLPNDHVKGHNPVSGYAQTQDGKKLGLYAEYIERTSPDWLLGANAEIWKSYNRRMKSTWSGDKPQDRGSLSANVFAQYRVNDEWQVRGILGASHQNWDKLNFANAALEGRYRETVMFGPRLSVALNKPDTYKNVSRGDLTTLGAFVRLELGDTFRVWDREARENSVRYVGPAMSTPTQ